jgi:hypothetical protein
MDDFIPDPVLPGEADICNYKVVIPDVELGSGVGIEDQVGPSEVVAVLKAITDNVAHYSGGMFGFDDNEIEPTFWVNYRDFRFRTMFRDTAKQFFTTQSSYDVNDPDVVQLRTVHQMRQDIDSLPIDPNIGDVIRSDVSMLAVAQRWAKSTDYTVQDVFHPYQFPNFTPMLANRFVAGQPVYQDNGYLMNMAEFYDDPMPPAVPVVMTGGVYSDVEVPQPVSSLALGLYW